MSIAQKTVKELANHYRQWLNDFISIGAYADYLGIEDSEALSIVNMGRIAHESGF